MLMKKMAELNKNPIVKYILTSIYVQNYLKLPIMKPIVVPKTMKLRVNNVDQTMKGLD